MDDRVDETCELLVRWHGGEMDAIHLLIDRDRAWIYDRIKRRRGSLLRQHVETMDDFQDLVLRMLEYSPRFVAANRRQFRGLLARMIENLLAHNARRLGQLRERPLTNWNGATHITLDPAVVDDGTRPDDAAERSEMLAWLQIGLEFLPEDQRDLVWRRHFEERSFAEIGTATGTSPDAVRMRVSRALLLVAGIVERLQRGELEQLLAEDGADLAG